MASTLNSKGARNGDQNARAQIIDVTVAVGWPVRPFRPVKRKAIADVMYVDTR
jgi:hypothetical protein